MNLYINGRFLTQRITGVQRFAIEIVKSLDRIVKSEDNIVILVPPEEIVNHVTLKNIEIKTIGRLRGNLWIQISLPIYIKCHKGELLTLSGLCPLIMPEYWTVHDITFIRYPESFNWRFRTIYKLFYKTALPRCKGIFTVSNFSKNEISDEFGLDKSRFRVVYNSANYLLESHYEEVDISKYGIKEGEYYLSVSSRNKHKNQNFIIELAKRHPEINYVIAGGGNKTFNSVENCAMPNVIYTGYVSDDELNVLYKNAAGFIFPSLYEGFGIPPLEAIISGCGAVAVSDIPVFREIYNNVYFFDPNEPDQFSFHDFLQCIIDDECKNLYIKKFSYDQSAEVYMNSIR